MKQKQFEQQHQADWQAFARTLSRLEQPGGWRSLPADTLKHFPQHYKAIAHQQALARERGYGLDLIAHLNDLTLRGHRQLYRTSKPMASRIARFVLQDFPRSVRAHLGWIVFSSVLFYGVTLLTTLALLKSPDLAYAVMDPEAVANLESMYDPQAPHQQQARGSGDDLQMFGFYIMNNIGIGFRTWASGIFFGIGALLVLITNGVFFGAAAGHLVNVGYSTPFFTFVIAHGAPELTAIVIAGAAGMKLGWAILSPSPWSVRTSLMRAVRHTLPLIYGVFTLLLLAAFIEAFWSSRPLPEVIKYSVGAGSWLLLLLYLARAGRVPHAD